MKCRARDSMTERLRRRWEWTERVCGKLLHFTGMWSGWSYKATWSMMNGEMERFFVNLWGRMWEMRVSRQIQKFGKHCNLNVTNQILKNAWGKNLLDWNVYVRCESLHFLPFLHSLQNIYYLTCLADVKMKKLWKIMSQKWENMLKDSEQTVLSKYIFRDGIT